MKKSYNTYTYTYFNIFFYYKFIHSFLRQSTLTQKWNSKVTQKMFQLAQTPNKVSNMIFRETNGQTLFHVARGISLAC